jgi:hypothetical protein
VFNNCGHNAASTAYGLSFSKKDYGLHGRIPPYLLYPFYDAPSVQLDYFFHNCKVVSPYVLDGTIYVIPADLFKYCPNVTSLVFTFAGMTFPSGVDLNVFSTINPNKLVDISYCFYTAYFYGNSTKMVQVSNVFSTMKNLGKTLIDNTTTDNYRRYGS